MPVDPSPLPSVPTADLPTRAYAAPELHELGTLEELTLGDSGTDPDGMFSMDNSIGPS